jgi:hypothetical protein
MKNISDQLNQNSATFIDTRTAQNADAAKSLRHATHGPFDKLKMPDVPKLQMADANLNLPSTNLIGGAGEASKLGALVRGSEESYKASHESNGDRQNEMLKVNQ